MSKRSRWILAGLVVIVTIPCVIYGVAVAQSKARLRQAYAALERDGRPMREADVQPVEIPDAENAAVLYARAASLLKGERVETKELLEYLGLVSFTCATIQGLCEIQPPTGPDSQRIEVLLKDLDDVRPLVRVMDGERLLVAERVFSLPEDRLYSVVKDPLARGGDPMGETINRLEFRLAVLGPRLIADHAAYLEFVRRSTLLLERPPSDGASDLRRQIDGLMTQGPVTMKLALRVGYVERLYRSMAAGVRVTQAGLAALRYRQTQGTPPQTLNALELKGLVDPYTQAALRYRPEGEGFVVYSVGEDLKDNGGTPRQHNQATDYDLVWRFPGQTGQGADHAD